MTFAEKKAAKLTGYGVALFIVVYIAPAFVIGGHYIPVAFIGSAAAMLLAALVATVYYTIFECLDDDDKQEENND